MNKNNNHNKKSFSHKSSHNRGQDFKDHFSPTPEVVLSSITRETKGKRVSIKGIIDQIEQTGGPTIFYITDGTGTFACKGFEKAGVRAFPEIDVGDAVKLSITIGEYNDEIEGEIDKVFKLPPIDKEAIIEYIKQLEFQRAQAVDAPFLIQDNILLKLKDRMLKAATQIRLAIIQNRPVVVRHHNDTDGYSSGYSLERAILPLVVKQHNSFKAAWEFYTRAPVNAPMYEIDDSIRDTAHSLAHKAKFSNKMPLVLIVDTGSGEKDVMGIKQGKVHGIDFIVVDHHAFDKDLVSSEVLVHINPFLVGEDGNKFSAGMLCSELARFINPDPTLNILQIPAMAGLADRTDNPSAMESYLKIAASKGYDAQLLSDISTVIDFVSSKLRFMEAREYIETLFGEPMDKQKALVALLGPYIRNLENKGLAIAKEAVKRESIHHTTVQWLDIETTYARGFYPKPGRCVSLIHDYAQEVDKLNKVVTLGTMPDAVTIRASADSNFSIHALLDYLGKDVPEAFAEGGGHKFAGSLRFLPSKRDKVKKAVEHYIKTLA